MERFVATSPCPICGGCPSDPHGQGIRCYGFLSDDGLWAHCTREECAGDLERHAKSDTFPHRLAGDCNCGKSHDGGASVRQPNQAKRAPPSSPVVAYYLYFDEHGVPLYRVDRHADKSFPQYRYDNGRWLPGLNSTRSVLYKLPELLAADPAEPVYVPEGEKDVHRLRAMGLVTTCNPCGAGKWQDAYSEYLRGRHVVLLQDNDAKGREHTDKVARSLRGIAASVRIVTFEDLPQHGDVSDWLDVAGHTKEDLLERVRNTPPVARCRGTDIMELLGRTLPPLREVVPGILPEGAVVLSGRSKIGKTWMGQGLAVAVATGGKALGAIDVERGRVLYLALEDGERRVQERFRRLLQGSKVRPLLDYETSWPRLDDGGLAEMEAWLQAHPDGRLIVVDILQMIRPRQPGKRLYAEDYEAIQPLRDLASKYHVAILILHHNNQSDHEDAFSLMSGTEGLPAAADAGWVLKRRRGEGEAELHIDGRDVEQVVVPLRWDAATTSWQMAGDAAERLMSKERRAIRDAIAQAGRRLTPKEIAERLDKPASTIRTTVIRMADAGQLVTDGKSGRYGTPGMPAESAADHDAQSPESPPETIPVDPVDSVDSPSKNGVFPPNTESTPDNAHVDSVDSPPGERPETLPDDRPESTESTPPLAAVDSPEWRKDANSEGRVYRVYRVYRDDAVDPSPQDREELEWAIQQGYIEAAS